jgi:hypothetical protein
MRNTQDNRARPGAVIASAVVRAADAASLVGAVRLIARQAGAPVVLQTEADCLCCGSLSAATRADAWKIGRHYRTAKHIAGTVGATPAAVRRVAAAIRTLADAAGVSVVSVTTGAALVRTLRALARRVETPEDGSVAGTVSLPEWVAAALDRHARWLRGDVVGGAPADLRGADLRGLDLRWSDLRGADLRWSDLRGTLLLGADVRFADLRGADVRFADLRGVDLRGSNLSRVNATGARIAGLDITGAMALVAPVGVQA